MAITDGLIAYYRLEADGTDSAQGINGTATATSIVAGKIGNALSFNGSTSKIVTTHQSSLNTGTNISVFAWVKPTAVTGGVFGAIVAKLADGFTNGWELSQTNNMIECTLRNSTIDRVSTAVLAADTWCHVGFTYNGTTLQIYINGSANNWINGTSTVDSSADLKIGCRKTTASDFFNGVVDEVGIWNRVITSGEISQLYNSGNGTQLFGNVNYKMGMPFHVYGASIGE